MSGKQVQKLEIYGLLNDVNFQRARFCAEVSLFIIQIRYIDSGGKKNHPTTLNPVTKCTVYISNLLCAGSLLAFKFVFPCHFLKDLAKKSPDVFKEAVVNGMLEFEWDLFIEAKMKVSIKTWLF